jgi:hypothetical protein
VSIMGEIFSQASFVISWLGVASEDSDLAIRKLKEVGGALDLQDPEDVQRGAQAVISLFRRPYWQRAWILQEMALANDLVFMCGVTTISHWDLMMGIVAYEKLEDIVTSSSMEGSEQFDRATVGLILAMNRILN